MTKHWKERAKEILIEIGDGRVRYDRILYRLEKEGYKKLTLYDLKHYLVSERNLEKVKTIVTPLVDKPKVIIPKIDEAKVLQELIAKQKQTVLDGYKDKLLKDNIKTVAATEVIIDALLESIKKQPYIKISPIQVPTIGTQEQRVVLLLSDIQAGTYIDRESTGGLNEYNQYIRKLQFAKLTDGITSITHKMRHSSPINTLHVHMIGDMIEGLDIFAGQAQHVDQDLYDQVFDLADDICKMYIELLNMFDHINVKGVVGNHGRVGKKGENPHWVNWDLIVYKFIETRLSAYTDRISFDFPKSWWMIDDILGHKFLMTHGDGIKSWGGIPFYGLQRADIRWTQMLQSIKEDYQYIEFGHFHTPTYLPRVVGELIVNGCWPGGSMFALKDLNTSIKPSQAFFGVHPEQGITFRYPIWLDVKSEV